MKKSKFAEEQIAYAFRQAETGTKVSEVYRKIYNLDRNEVRKSCLCFSTNYEAR